MDFISLTNISKRFYNRLVLDNINLSIPRGAFVSIVGPYGSGKTTLLRMLAGLDNAYTGDIHIYGKKPIELIKCKKIGYAFQHPTLLPWRNVIENITLPSELNNKTDISKAEALLKFMNIENLAFKKISELSGGMRQLVSILRALSLDPDVLLLDEPFSSIDEINKDKLHEEVLKLHKQNNETIIMVTHSLHEAVYLSDMIIVLGGNPTTISHVIKPTLIKRNLKMKYSQEVIEQVNSLRKELAQL